MLDTVLQIGRTLRDPENRAKGLKHHRYVRQCPSGEDEDVLRLRIPVSEAFEIDFEGIAVLDDENIFDKLRYFEYRTSENDSTMKYVCGDLYYNQDSGKYYRLPKPKKQGYHGKGSFDRGEKHAQEFIEYEKGIEGARKSLIHNFRELLARPAAGNRQPEPGSSEVPRNIDLIERLMKYQTGVRYLLEKNGSIAANGLTTKQTLLDEAKLRDVISEEKNTSASESVFLHFDFAGKHWYELETVTKAIDQQLVSKFAEPFSDDDLHGAVITKFFYKTLIASEKNRQLPEFDLDNRHRLRLLSEDELANLFYAIDIANHAKFSTASIKVVVLPKGEEMQADDITRFIEPAGSLREATQQEQELQGRVKARSKKLEAADSLFTAILSDANESITQFDLVFSERGSKGDKDIVELSGVSKGFLQKVHRRIKEIKKELSSKWEEQFEYSLDGMHIQKAFKRLTGDLGQDKPKYEQHLYQVLPKIYTETYYRDPLLLPALIERTERAIREDGISKRRYNQRKFDFYLLAKIQNTPTEDENLMRILNSPSYKLGLPLGVMARPLRSRIKSFEKNYVGNLRRRIATLDDLVEFKNDVEEMLVRHEASRMSTVDEARQELIEAIETLENGRRLDKNQCALGFFETYFEPYEDRESDEEN